MSRRKRLFSGCDDYMDSSSDEGDEDTTENENIRFNKIQRNRLSSIKNKGHGPLFSSCSSNSVKKTVAGRSSSPTKQSTSKGFTRGRPYTYEEDKKLIEYVVAEDNRYLDALYLKFWTEVETLGIVPGRTAYSLQTRFLKLCQTLEQFPIDPNLVRTIKEYIRLPAKARNQKRVNAGIPIDEAWHHKRGTRFSYREDLAIMQFVKNKNQGADPRTSLSFWSDAEVQKICPERSAYSIMLRYRRLKKKDDLRAEMNSYRSDDDHEDEEEAESSEKRGSSRSRSRSDDDWNSQKPGKKQRTDNNVVVEIDDQEDDANGNGTNTNPYKKRSVWTFGESNSHRKSAINNNASMDNVIDLGTSDTDVDEPPKRANVKIEVNTSANTSTNANINTNTSTSSNMNTNANTSINTNGRNNLPIASGTKNNSNVDNIIYLDSSDDTAEEVTMRRTKVKEERNVSSTEEDSNPAITFKSIHRKFSIQSDSEDTTLNESDQQFVESCNLSYDLLIPNTNLSPEDENTNDTPSQNLMNYSMNRQNSWANETIYQDTNCIPPTCSSRIINLTNKSNRRDYKNESNENVPNRGLKDKAQGNLPGKSGTSAPVAGNSRIILRKCESNDDTLSSKEGSTNSSSNAHDEHQSVARRKTRSRFSAKDAEVQTTLSFSKINLEINDKTLTDSVNCEDTPIKEEVVDQPPNVANDADTSNAPRSETSTLDQQNLKTNIENKECERAHTPVKSREEISSDEETIIINSNNEVITTAANNKTVCESRGSKSTEKGTKNIKSPLALRKNPDGVNAVRCKSEKSSADSVDDFVSCRSNYESCDRLSEISASPGSTTLIENENMNSFLEDVKNHRVKVPSAQTLDKVEEFFEWVRNVHVNEAESDDDLSTDCSNGTISNHRRAKLLFKELKSLVNKR